MDRGFQRWSLALLVGVSMLGLIGASRSDSTQASTETPNRQPVAALASRARSNAPTDVRRLTDAILDNSLARSSSLSLRDRLYKNEMAFRSQGVASITPQLLRTAINDEVARLGAPDHMRFSDGQMRLAREDLSPVLRHLKLAERGSVYDLDENLSPSEAVVLAMHLTLQKLANPEYRVAPETWERNALAKRTTAAAPRSPGVPLMKVSARFDLA